MFHRQRATTRVLHRRPGDSSHSLPARVTPVLSSVRGGDETAQTAVGAFLRALASLGLGGLAGVLSWQFAAAFPFVITPAAAKHAFVPAGFSYNAGESFFCDSAWTIWTDYGLGAVMVCLATQIFRSGRALSAAGAPRSEDRPRAASVRRIRNLGMALSLLYAVQFSVAGILHQVSGRGSLHFEDWIMDDHEKLIVIHFCC